MNSDEEDAQNFNGEHNGASLSRRNTEQKNTRYQPLDPLVSPMSAEMILSWPSF